MILHVHHIAIICSNYEFSKAWYMQVLGLTLVHESYRADRDSWKGDLVLNDNYIIELFSFPNSPPRVSRPEACGLRHLAFAVDNLDDELERLNKLNVAAEPIRLDGNTGKRFTFIADPDGLPIELYEHKN